MNAEAFVIASKEWKNVPEQHTCVTVFPTFSKRFFRTVTSFTVIFVYRRYVFCN